VKEILRSRGGQPDPEQALLASAEQTGADEEQKKCRIYDERQPKKLYWRERKYGFKIS